MFRITRTFFSIPIPKTKSHAFRLPAIHHPMNIQPVYPSLFRFSTQKKETESEAENKEEMEFLKRKKQLEKAELEALKKKMGEYDSRFTLYNDLYGILKSKIFLAIFAVGMSLVAYQFYTFAEKIKDPITGQEKLIFLRYAYEKKLARAVQDVLKRNSTVVPRDQAVYAPLEEQYKKVSASPELKALNLVFNNDINIIEREDCIFLLLSNGSLFVSSGIVPFLKEGNNLLNLMMLELGHIYLRTNAQNVNLFDLMSLIKFKVSGFDTAKIQDPAVLHGIRTLYCLPINQEQEKKMQQILPTLLETVGVKKDIQKELDQLLEKLTAYDEKMNANQTLKDRRVENFFRRHPSLIRHKQE